MIPDHIVGVLHVPGGQAAEPIPHARLPLQPRHAADDHIPAQLRDTRHKQAGLLTVTRLAAGIVAMEQQFLIHAYLPEWPEGRSVSVDARTAPPGLDVCRYDTAGPNSRICRFRST